MSSRFAEKLGRPPAKTNAASAAPVADAPSDTSGDPEPPPTVRLINVRKPLPSGESLDAEGNRLFAEEGSAEGCASGECLPEEPAAPPAAPKAFVPTGGMPNAERWRLAVDAVRSASPRHGASLSNGRLLWFKRTDAGAIEIGLGFTKAAAFHRTTVSAATGKSTVEKALTEHFTRPVRLVIEEATDVVEAAAPSLAEVDTRDREAHTRSTDVKVRSHPAVRATLKALGGEIEHIQVFEKVRPALSADPGEAPPED